MKTQQRTDDRAEQRELLGRVRDRIAEMTKPKTTRTEQWVPTADGSKLVPQVHQVEHPSLLDQLRMGISQTTAGGASAAGSRPPANLELIDALQLVRREVHGWVTHDCQQNLTGSIEGDLTVVADRAGTFDRDSLVDLDRDVQRWWGRARIATTWDTPPLQPFVPCMACNARGKLRVRVTPLVAVCLECGATWDESTIGVLGNHIRLMLERPHELEQPDGHGDTSEEM